MSDMYGNETSAPDFDMSFLEDPKNAPPNSRWDKETGQWVTTAPNQAGYDPTWGGYTQGNPNAKPADDPNAGWLKSVYENQGWELPAVTPTAVTTAPPPDRPNTTTPAISPVDRQGTSTAGWLPPTRDSGGGASNIYYQYQQDPAIARAMEAQNQLMQQMFAQQASERARNRERGDTLYGQLMQRANQGLNVDPNNPVIKAQTDAFAAQQERARRNYLSDTAEREGPFANLRGERRMASERAGQATGSLQAQLMGREVDAKRQEIQAALSGAAGLLTADQEANLRQQLGMLGNLADQQRIGISGQALGLDNLRAQLQDRQYYAGLGSQEDQFGANYGLDAWQRARDLERLRDLPIGSVNYGY